MLIEYPKNNNRFMVKYVQKACNNLTVHYTTNMTYPHFAIHFLSACENHGKILNVSG